MTDQNDRRWVLDFIRPLADFDLTEPEQRAAAFSIHNLRPVWEDEWSAILSKRGLEAHATSCGIRPDFGHSLRLDQRSGAGTKSLA
jgi:hypothetical protein